MVLLANFPLFKIKKSYSKLKKPFEMENNMIRKRNVQCGEVLGTYWHVELVLSLLTLNR